MDTSGPVHIGIIVRCCIVVVSCHISFSRAPSKPRGSHKKKNNSSLQTDRIETVDKQAGSSRDGWMDSGRQQFTWVLSSFPSRRNGALEGGDVYCLLCWSENGQRKKSLRYVYGRGKTRIGRVCYNLATADQKTEWEKLKKCTLWARQRSRKVEEREEAHGRITFP